MLKKYTTDNVISISGHYLQSFKYFHAFKKDIVRLLAFARSDVKEAKKLSERLFGKDKSLRICVHIRRRDFVSSPMHQHSTEEFTKAAVKYVREKLIDTDKKSIVAFIGKITSYSLMNTY